MASQDTEMLKVALEEAAKVGVGEKHYMPDGTEAGLDPEEVPESPEEEPAQGASKSRWQRMKSAVGIEVVPGSGADLLKQSTRWLDTVIDGRAAVTKQLQAALTKEMSKLDCIGLQDTFDRATKVGVSTEASKGVDEELLGRAKQWVEQTLLERTKADAALGEASEFAKQGLLFSELTDDQQVRVKEALKHAKDSGMCHSKHVLANGMKGVDVYTRVEGWRCMKHLNEAEKLALKKPGELQFSQRDFWGKQVVSDPSATKTGLATIDDVLQPGVIAVSDMQAMHNEIFFLSQNLKSFTASLLGGCELMVDESKTASLGLPALSIVKNQSSSTLTVATIDCIEGLKVLDAAQFKELDTDKQNVKLSQLAESVAEWLKFLHLAVKRRHEQKYPGPDLKVGILDPNNPAIQLQLIQNGFKECDHIVTTPIKYNQLDEESPYPQSLACCGCVDCCCTTGDPAIELDGLIERHKVRSTREFRHTEKSIAEAKKEVDKRNAEDTKEIDHKPDQQGAGKARPRASHARCEGWFERRARRYNQRRHALAQGCG